MWHNNLYIFVQALVADFKAFLLSHLRSFTHLLSCFVQALLLFICTLAVKSHTYLLPLTALISCLKMAIALLLFFVLTPIFGSLVILLPLSMLYLNPSHLAFLALKTFKQALSDMFLHCHLINYIKFLYLFLSFGLLLNKIGRKQIFNTAFINSCSIDNNYSWKKVDISFAQCGCFGTVKLNQLCQLKLLDLILVCIIEIISLAAALF